MASEARICDLLRGDLLHFRRLLGGDTGGMRLWLGLLAPRFLPVLLYRLSHRLMTLRLTLFSRFLSMLNCVLFGIEIAAGCRIGKGLFLPHTHGTVIGAFEIGEDAVIYHGVTLGARGLDFTFDPACRPVLGNGVLVGAGAVVLGGIRIGNLARIGANSVVLHDVADGGTVAGNPARPVDSTALTPGRPR